MKINNIILIALIGMLGNIISTPTAVALPPFSGVIEYYNSAESGYTTIGAKSALFGNNIPVTINLSDQNEPRSISNAFKNPCICK